MTIAFDDDALMDSTDILDDQAVADLSEYEHELHHFHADTSVFWSTLAAAGIEDEYKRKKKELAA